MNQEEESIYKDLFGESWWKAIQPYFDKTYFNKLGQFLNKERESKSILPAKEKVFRVFKESSYNEIKVSIIALDPYPNIHQACGRAFAVEDDCMVIPTSLKILAQEVERSFCNGLNVDFDYSLGNWVKQGVLLLNCAMTVVEGKTGSHLKEWEPFTRMIFKALSDKNRLVYLLLGKEAQKYKPLIPNKHPIIESFHPAAASYNPANTLVGSNCFIKVNEELNNLNLKEIIW